MNFIGDYVVICGNDAHSDEFEIRNQPVLGMKIIYLCHTYNGLLILISFCKEVVPYAQEFKENSRDVCHLVVSEAICF